jgi:hypothetical protein
MILAFCFVYGKKLFSRKAYLNVRETTFGDNHFFLSVLTVYTPSFEILMNVCLRLLTKHKSGFSSLY